MKMYRGGNNSLLDRKGRIIISDDFPIGDCKEEQQAIFNWLLECPLEAYLQSLYQCNATPEWWQERIDEELASGRPNKKRTDWLVAQKQLAHKYT